MKEIIEITMEDNSKLYIESNAPHISNSVDPSRIPASAADGLLKKADGFLDSSFAQIQKFSSRIAEAIKASHIQPDELEVEFGVKFSADAGIIISTVSTEANITIKMHWNDINK